MSRESAENFLEAATVDSILRDKLTAAGNFEEFVQIAQSIGYNFTAQELKLVIKEHSEGVTMRRKTGVWPWLRHFSWI